MIDFETYQALVKTLPFGKRVGKTHYALKDDILTANVELKKLVDQIKNNIKDYETYNLLKFHLDDYKISFLSYPSFFDVLHPALTASLTIHLHTGKQRLINYNNNINRPILHRKETFIDPKRREYSLYKKLTKKEEELGLYINSNTIGFFLTWEKLLLEKGIVIDGHNITVLEVSEESEIKNNDIKRHKTAISRSNFSRPVQLLLKHNLMTSGKTFFDYGCGKGDDIRALVANNYEALGWDPVFAPKEIKTMSDVVNLGYVLNVIEDPDERIETLKQAYGLTKYVLAVSTLITTNSISENARPFGDGIITSRNTFQKYFEQNEIHHLIEEILCVSAVAVDPGVFFVFKKEKDLQSFYYSRNRRLIDWSNMNRLVYPDRSEIRKAKKDDLYNENKELIESFWERMIELGRLPKENEFRLWNELKNRVTNPVNLQQWFIERYGKQQLEDSFQKKREDLLVYLALSNFKKKVPFAQLSKTMQYNIKTFFGNYTEAQNISLRELYKIGNPDIIEELSNKFDKGRIDHQALFISKDIIKELPPVLRMYVGAAELLYGDIDSVDIIKIHKRSGKVTFLIYNDYQNKGETDLKYRIKINLITQRIDFFDHR